MTTKSSLLIFALFSLVLVSCNRKGRILTALGKGDTNYLRQVLVVSNSANQTFAFGSHGKSRAPLIGFAIQNGQVESVKLLLRLGADPNQRDSSGEIPLAWACGHIRNDVKGESVLQIVEALLLAGADPNLKDSAGYTPLIWASSFGQSQIVDLLLKKGANVNETNNAGLSALHLAKNVEVARSLIAAGARLDIQANGRTPIDTAKERGRFDVMGVLTNADGVNVERPQ